MDITHEQLHVVVRGGDGSGGSVDMRRTFWGVTPRPPVHPTSSRPEVVQPLPAGASQQGSPAGFGSGGGMGSETAHGLQQQPEAEGGDGGRRPPISEEVSVLEPPLGYQAVVPEQCSWALEASTSSSSSSGGRGAAVAPAAGKTLSITLALPAPDQEEIAYKKGGTSCTLLGGPIRPIESGRWS